MYFSAVHKTKYKHCQIVHTDRTRII